MVEFASELMRYDKRLDEEISRMKYEYAEQYMVAFLHLQLRNG